MAVFNTKSTGAVSKHAFGPMVAKSSYRSLFGDVEAIERNRTEYYLRGVNQISTASAIGNTWNPQVLEQGYTLGSITAKCYNITAKYEYNEYDIDNFNYNLDGRMSLTDLQNKLTDLAIGQRLRSMALHGAEANSGLVAGSTVVNLSNDWSKVAPGVMLQELITHISDAQAKVLNAGTKIMICGTIELLNKLRGALVNTDTYLKSGSTGTIASSLEAVLSESFKKEVEIVMDNTLKKSDGKLQLLVVFPNLQYSFEDEVNGVGDNFGTSQIGTWMGVSAGKDIVNPVISGIYSGQTTLTATSGVVVRDGASIVIEAKA